MWQHILCSLVPKGVEEDIIGWNRHLHHQCWTAPKWNHAHRSWRGVGAGERRGLVKWTGNLMVSYIIGLILYLPIILNGKHLNTKAMTVSRHLGQLAEAVLSATRFLSLWGTLRGHKEGVHSTGEVWSQKMRRTKLSRKCTILASHLLPRMSVTQRKCRGWNHWSLSHTAKSHAA